MTRRKRMNKEKVVYAAYSKNNSIRLNSSSGAVFYHLAESVITKGGVVYGVTMSEDLRKAHFLCVSDLGQLKKIMRSKYLQASLGDTFIKVKKQLEKGVLVLFSGIGCQISGLKAFLRKDYDNLICVDVVCHGTPSPKLWRAYVDYIENKYHAKLTDVNFRCKDDCWTDFKKKNYVDGRKTVFVSINRDPYMLMFLRDYSLRASCYECVAKKQSKADITLADFWGIHRIYPDMDDGNGTSLVIIRTNTGQSLFESIKENLIFRSVKYEDAIQGNKAEYQSAKRPKERDNFYKDFEQVGFNGIVEKYGLPQKISSVEKIKKFTKRFAKKCMQPIRKECRIRAAYEYGLSFVFEKQSKK